MAGALFGVGTPIGTLADISARALDALRSASFIVCEDTRHSRVLLAHYRISKETLSLPAFAERERSGRILDRLSAGEDCALITDAGSPGISDPGQALVSGDRKSTRLNSSHVRISYAVFCLKKKKIESAEGDRGTKKICVGER